MNGSDLRVAILGNPGSWYVESLTAAGRARGHRVDRIDYHRLVGGVTGLGEDQRTELSIAIETDDGSKETCVTATDFDVLLVRTMPPGSLEQVIFRMNLLERWRRAGVRVINPPRAIECAVDKYLTTATLYAAGLPVPETIACENEADALTAFERLGGDVVIKPLFGGEGRGILRVSDPDLMLRTARTLSRLHTVLYLQRFVAHNGFDTRILLLANEPLAVYRRWASDGDYRTNLSRRGKVECVEPTDNQLELARRAAAATGCVMAGIDLLRPNGLDTDLVLEVNAVPGWRGFERAEGSPVAPRLFDWIERTNQAW